MKYMGSKNRHSKELLKIILKERTYNQWYIEPFVGGANMIDKVKGKTFGSDKNEIVIRALKFIRDNSDKIPKNNNEFTEYNYKQLRAKFKSSNLSDLECFACFAYSYSGKFIGGWRRDGENKRDYVAESYRNAIKQKDGIEHVNLQSICYSEIRLPKEPSIVYCDPPYKNTTRYPEDFDHNLFYKWCINKTNDGHKVYISEYDMPVNNFKLLWEKKVNSSLTKDTGGKKNVEKLFFCVVD